MTADRLVITAARMRQAVSSVAWHSRGSPRSPDLERTLALMEVTTEIATLMALEVASKPVAPIPRDVLYRRMLLAMAHDWIDDRSRFVFEHAERAMREMRRPIPAVLRRTPALTALLPQVRFGDRNPLPESSKRELLDRLLADTRMAEGTRRDIADVRDGLAWRVRLGSRHSDGRRGTLHDAADLWAFSLLERHGCRRSALLWAQMDLRLESLKTTDMLSVARSIRLVAESAVPAVRGLSLTPPIDIVIDLTEVGVHRS